MVLARFDKLSKICLPNMETQEAEAIDIRLSSSISIENESTEAWVSEQLLRESSLHHRVSWRPAQEEDCRKTSIKPPKVSAQIDNWKRNQRHKGRARQDNGQRWNLLVRHRDRERIKRDGRKRYHRRRKSKWDLVRWKVPRFGSVTRWLEAVDGHCLRVDYS